MGNSPSSPGVDGGNSNSSSGSSGKQSSSSTNKQSQAIGASGTPHTGAGAATGPARGTHSNIPINPTLTHKQQQQQQQQQQQHPQNRPGHLPYVQGQGHVRPPPPAIPPQPRPQQLQHRPVSQYVPTPYLQHLQNNQSRPPQPNNSQPPSHRITHPPPPPQQPSSASTPAEDEIPTIVLQEQMETMLIDIATTESRVRELREELDTFESHPIFSSMMLAWFLSFNPGDYSIHRLDDLKRDALKAWQPVLSAFVQDNSSGGSQGGQNLTEIEVRLFESIIQDVISHANMIAGSTLPPEELIQNLIQVAHSELEKTRWTLEQNRNAFQECQLTLQSRGVIPTSVLEMQRQIEEEQKREQEARKAKEQRQKELIAQKQRELQRKRELEEQERQKEREQEEIRLMELEKQRQQEEQRKKREEVLRLEREEQRKQETLKKKQEELWQRMEARQTRPASANASMSPATHALNPGSGRPKASSISSPISVPVYSAAFAKRLHPESTVAFGVNITEEDTVLTDQDSQEAHFSAQFSSPYGSSKPEHERANSYSVPGGYPPKNTANLEDEDIPSTPLLRRPRPVANVTETVASSSLDVTTSAHQLPYPPPSPGVSSRLPLPMQMPMPMPYVPDFHQKQYGQGQGQGQGHGQQTQEVPHSVPETIPALYPPQIISEHELQERLAQEQLEQIKRQNEEMERKIYLGQQEHQRLHALSLQSMEMQGAQAVSGYPGSQQEYVDHTQQMQSQFTNQGSYPPFAQQQQQQQQQQQHQQQKYQQGYMAQHSLQQQPQQQQGYHIYPPEHVSSQYNAVVNSSQEQFNYQQQYGGYSNQNITSNTTNWGSHPHQNPGYMQHHQQQQQHHHQHPSSLSQAQQQQLYQQQQQQQQFQQQLPPGQQDPNGYSAQHLHANNVTYSVSPHGQEYDFTPAIVPGPVASTAEVVTSISAPISTSASTSTSTAAAAAASTDLSDSTPENDASSPAVLPQIRANPVKTPVRRGPQAILSDEQKEAAANALKEEEKEKEIQEQDGDQAPEEDEAQQSRSDVNETEAGSSEEKNLAQDEDITEANSCKELPSITKELPAVPPSTPISKAHKSSEKQDNEHEVMDEEEEEEEEEEVLHRSVRKMRISPVVSSPSAPAPVPGTLPATSLRPAGNRTSVFAPFPPRAAPRPAPRPSPRPVSVMLEDPIKTAEKEVKPVAVDSSGSVSDDGSAPTAATSGGGPKNMQSTESIKRLSMLHRAPSLPPVVPKKPAALRSPRSPTSEAS
ncbi:hypothetical protein BGX28_003135 [Mortierella sp. GBA30]|nr:hypothetical protein BGX28_003135 [Mortierella sp. GBA30]